MAPQPVTLRPRKQSMLYWTFGEVAVETANVALAALQLVACCAFYPGSRYCVPPKHLHAAM